MKRMIIMPDEFQDLDKVRVQERVDRAKCPKCGDGVFIVAEGWQKQYGGTPENPVLSCRDMGHWWGFLSECK